MGKPSLYVTSHPGQLSHAIPPQVGKMSTGDDYGHRQGRNGEFCVTVGPVTRTADILTQSVICGLGLYASLIWFDPRRLKPQSAEKEMSSHAMDLAVYAKSSSSSSILLVDVSYVMERISFTCRNVTK